MGQQTLAVKPSHSIKEVRSAGKKGICSVRKEIESVWLTGKVLYVCKKKA